MSARDGHAPPAPGRQGPLPDRRRGRAATIHDVARQAGVASITVSRVLNGSAPTSEAARRRVHQAVADLGYVPNALAQGLKAQATRTIGLIVSDISNRFFTSVVRGVEDVVYRAGYCLILCNTDENPDKERLYLETLGRQRVDGLLVAHSGSDPKTLLAWERRYGPICLIDRALPDVDATAHGLDVVRTANAQVAASLVTHLIAHGHRRIAIVNGPPTIFTARRRLAGYRQALTAAGLPQHPGLEWHGHFTAQSGYAGAMALLATSQPPTAIFTTNNFLTIGVLAAFRARGRRVPEDCALVGFDDIDELALLDPFITVASQPADAVGRQAAVCLLERIRHRAGQATGAPRDLPGRVIVLPTDLIIRRSCGCPAGSVQPWDDGPAPTTSPSLAGDVALGVGRRVDGDHPRPPPAGAG